MDVHSSAGAAQAWSTFWASQGPGSRCLADAPPEILNPLDSHWRRFATSIAPSAAVLDLGCGAGAVGRELLAGQSQLHVTGIDIAIVPASSDARIRLLPCTPMELLPFKDHSFAAAVSQFGYEYGNRWQAASEAARVLAPGARLSLLIHHRDSPIVAGMHLHKRNLEGLVDGPVKSAFLRGDSDALERELATLASECRGDTIIDQAGRGLRAHIEQDFTRRAAVWRAVEDALSPELVMLRELDESRIGSSDIGYWTGPLGRDFDLQSPDVVSTASGDPIAWVIEGVRSW
jgi:SAM-dependent methyltransferase